MGHQWAVMRYAIYLRSITQGKDKTTITHNEGKAMIAKKQRKCCKREMSSDNYLKPWSGLSPTMGPGTLPCFMSPWQNEIWTCDGVSEGMDKKEEEVRQG